MIGINNRDLRTFEVDLAVTERLRPKVPMDRVVIALSGVHRRADVERMAKAQVHAVLVGESLMTAPDIPSKLRELLL
jgi:indole-3-glycerol phosphate synthase